MRPSWAFVAVLPSSLIIMPNKHPATKQRYTIGYCRKSTDREDKQIRSLEDQRKLIESFYESLNDEGNNHGILMLEESKSAYIPDNRPEFDKILDMADKGEVQRVIVIDPTRISRNHEDTGKFVQRLADGRMPAVLTVSGKKYDRDDTGQIFMLTLENTMSWKDSADKGVRVSLGMKEKAKEGGSTGWAPIGYMNKAENNRKYIEPDPDTAPVVKNLFVLAATGAYSLEALAVKAKKSGLRTRATKRHPNGLSPQRTTIHQMLRNPTYKGMKPYMGEVHKGDHIGLIEPELWEKVQLELVKRCTNTDRSQDLSLRELFTMAGCVRCGKCLVRTMSPYKAKGKYVTYECKNRKTKCCNSIRQEELIEQLNTEIGRLSFSEDEYELVKKTLKDVHEKATSNQSERRNVLEKEYKIIEKQVTDVFMNMNEAKKYGIEETISMKLAQLKMRKDELKEAMDHLHNESDEWIDHVLRCFELVKVTKQAIKIASPEIRQALLKSLCSNYIVKDKKLVCDWYSPFKEKLEGNHSIWLPGSDSNRRPIR